MAGLCIMPTRLVLAGGSLLLAVALVACASASSPRERAATPTSTAAATLPTASPTLAGPPSYTPEILAHGFGQPDDLTLDSQGHVIFADQANGSVARIESDGRVTILVRGLRQPEGVIAEPDGSLLVAVQGTSGAGVDAILRLAPGSATPQPFASFPNTTGAPGLDGISRDPRTGEILAADSPNGKVYRLSPDGRQVRLLAAGFVRPTDAIADVAGTVYVADEYGNKVARIASNGVVTTLAHLPLPDDLAFDVDGSLLVTVLNGDTLQRLDPASGRLLGTVQAGLHEPQGLAVDGAENLYVSEELANTVLELRRA